MESLDPSLSIPVKKTRGRPQGSRKRIMSGGQSSLFESDSAFLQRSGILGLKLIFNDFVRSRDINDECQWFKFDRYLNLLIKMS